MNVQPNTSFSHEVEVELQMLGWSKESSCAIVKKHADGVLAAQALNVTPYGVAHALHSSYKND